MSVGLIALLDEVAAMAKVAATSLDGVTAMAAKAGVKAAGVVIDDAAVTPRYVLGFSAERELPIVWRIAAGSLRNKLLLLLPASLALSYLLPSMITPLLMLGGVYLCYEGTEKVFEALIHQTHSRKIDVNALASNAHKLEEEKVAGAIKTDFILSAEIMAITLATVSDQAILMQAVVLALVGVGITAAVYGLVALVVKADDVGLALATGNRGSIAGATGRVLGRALVRGMPGFLNLLGAAGTAAMIWVGGSIFVHGLETFHFHFVGQTLHAIAAATAVVLPPAIGSQEAALVLLSAITGLAIGAASILLIEFVATPGRKLLQRTLRLHLGCLLPSDPSA